MAEGRIIARTATFALFRSPITLLDPGPTGKHSKANIYYALCVNRTTGRLDVIVWTTKAETAAQRAPATMVRMKPAAMFQCDLDVRVKRILGMVPYSWSFAMKKLPPGRKLRVPPALGARIIEVSRHPVKSDPEELERLLRKAIPATPDADVAGDGTVSPKGDGAVRRTASPPPYRTVQ